MTTLYIVQRRTWFEACAAYDDADCIEGGGVALAAYADRAAAVSHAARLERDALAEASSPFRLVGPDQLDYLGVNESELVAAVKGLGLEPPEPVKRRYSSERLWAHWYDDIADALTPAQRDGLFALFAKVVVYEVVEVPLEV